MSSKHIETKHKIQAIEKKLEFESLLDSSTLSPEDKQILKMIYLEARPLGYIADILGYSESTIKSRNKKSLNKLRKLFY